MTYQLLNSEGSAVGKFSLYIYMDQYEVGSSLPEHTEQSLSMFSSLDPLIRGPQAVDHISPGGFVMSMCSCHLSQSVYDNFITDVITRIPSATRAAPDKDIAQCLFPGCAASNYPAVVMVNQPPVMNTNTCEVPLCIETIEINNDGTIVANGPIQFSQACNSVQESSTQITEMQEELTDLSRSVGIIIGSTVGGGLFLLLIVVIVIAVVGLSYSKQIAQMPALSSQDYKIISQMIDPKR